MPVTESARKYTSANGVSGVDSGNISPNRTTLGCNRTLQAGRGR